MHTFLFQSAQWWGQFSILLCCHHRGYPFTSLIKLIPGYFILDTFVNEIFKNLQPRLYVLIFRERRRVGVGGEKRNIDVREKYQLVAFLYSS